MIKLLRIATDREATDICNEIRIWVDEILKAGAPFNDVRGVILSAVAEYVANQKGMTLYPNRKDTV